MHGPAKSTSYVSTKISDLSYLLYHNIITIYTNTTKQLLLMHNLMAILLQFTEMGYSFRTKDIELSGTHMVDFCRPGHCCQ